MKLSTVLYSTLASVGVVLAAIMPAQAFSVTFGADSQSSNPTATGASAFVDFNFSDAAGGVQLDLDIFNTTGNTTFGAGATTSKLTGIGFNVVDDITNVGSFNNTGFLDFLSLNDSLQPFGTFDVAILDNNNFEGGNANDALPQGQSTTASLLLSTTSSASEIEQDFLDLFSDGSNFVARFQQVNAGAGSDKLLGGTVNGGDPMNPEPVPEPFTILGSMAALGVGTVLKRKANKA